MEDEVLLFSNAPSRLNSLLHILAIMMAVLIFVSPVAVLPAIKHFNTPPGLAVWMLMSVSAVMVVLVAFAVKFGSRGFQKTQTIVFMPRDQKLIISSYRFGLAVHRLFLPTNRIKEILETRLQCSLCGKTVDSDGSTRIDCLISNGEKTLLGYFDSKTAGDITFRMSQCGIFSEVSLKKEEKPFGNTMPCEKCKTSTKSG